jgi:hypothetical protein
MLNFALSALATAAIIVVGLLFSGKRVLVYEYKVNPGETFVVEEHGNLGAAEAPSLYCRYFNGRSFVESVFWYSPNGLMGKDSCPFMASQ